MKLGSAIALLVIGAILSFAVKDGISGVDLTLIGYILMGAGAVGLLLVLILSRPKNHVSETHTVADPNTGEKVIRHESNGL